MSAKIKFVDEYLHNCIFACILTDDGQTCCPNLQIFKFDKMQICRLSCKLHDNLHLVEHTNSFYLELLKPVSRPWKFLCFLCCIFVTTSYHLFLPIWQGLDCAIKWEVRPCQIGRILFLYWFLCISQPNISSDRFMGPYEIHCWH